MSNVRLDNVKRDAEEQVVCRCTAARRLETVPGRGGEKEQASCSVSEV